MPETTETLSYQQLLNVIGGQLEHIISDLHHLTEEVARLQARSVRVDAMLTEFEPIIRLYASPVSAYTAARQARKRRGLMPRAADQ